MFYASMFYDFYISSNFYGFLCNLFLLYFNKVRHWFFDEFCIIVAQIDRIYNKKVADHGEIER